MSSTPLYGFPFVSEKQVLKYPTINNNFLGLETVISKLVQSMTLNSPPSHIAGASYIIGTSPTGDWAGHAGKYAYSDGVSWHISSPFTGQTVRDGATEKTYRYNGTSFVHVSEQIPRNMPPLIPADFINESGATQGQIAYSNFSMDTWDFTNGADDEISTQLLIPKQLSITGVSFDIVWTTAANATGNIRWKARFYPVQTSTSESINVGTVVTHEFTHTASGNTTPDARASSSSTFTLTGVQTDTQIIMKLMKEGTHVDDTFNQPLKFLELNIKYNEVEELRN